MTTEQNATQTGVFESASASRSNALQQIAKNVHDAQAGDLQTFDEETGQVTGQPQEEAPVQDNPIQAEDNPIQESDDGLETLIVDGLERKVKRDQVLEAGRRTLQKEAAADRRLEEANETLRRAKAYEQGLMQRRPSTDAADTQMPSGQDASNGSGEQARQATPDIGTLVDQRLWFHDATKAAQRFKSEFKDLVEDPFAARLVSQLEDERLAQAASEGSPLGDPWEAYKAHGEKVREWLSKARPQGAAMSEDRQERKRSTVTVTGSTTTRPQPTTQKPLTTSEIIEQQRLARRQGRQIQPTR